VGMGLMVGAIAALDGVQAVRGVHAAMPHL
jgi:hypothetical protein